jgi:tetratricopeptide (TPR) repeat protein
MSMGYMRKAQMLTNSGRADEAVTVLKDGVKHNPQDGNLRFTYANSLMQAGKTEESIPEFARAIDLQPENWMALFGHGAALLRLQQYGPARDSLNKAARLAPDKYRVHLALGSSLAALQDWPRAAKAFDDALKIEPENVQALVGASLARSSGGRHREALDMLLNTGRVGRRLPQVQKALGDVYLAMGRPTDALETYQAMVLNSQDGFSPEVTALAKSDAAGEPEILAKKLQDALRVQGAARGEEARNNPQSMRERLMSRGQGGGMGGGGMRGGAGGMGGGGGMRGGMGGFGGGRQGRNG